MKEKEEATLAGSFKNRTCFCVTEIVFFVIFPHFFLHQRKRISISVPLFTYKMPDFLQVKKEQAFLPVLSVRYRNFPWRYHYC